MEPHASLYSIWVSASVLSTFSVLAIAMPANPSVTRIQQPDGSTLVVTMRGDEFQGWMETVEGYTVVKNPRTGYLEYAVQSAGGTLAPSGAIATNARAADLASEPGLRPPKGLRPRRNTELERSQNEWLNQFKGNFAPRASSRLASAAPGPSKPRVTGVWEPRPVSGRKRVLVVLVNFADAALKTGASDFWHNAVFGTGPSVATFYKENSYGIVSIAPVPHSQAGSPDGVITVSLPVPHPNYGNANDPPAEIAWVNAALAKASKVVDFPSLDIDGDGTISVDEALIYFILAGYDTSAGSGLDPSIWAHRAGYRNVAVSGKVVNNWALNGEMYDLSTRMQMGVIAHEMGHAMGGLPDLYDTSQTNVGLGAFSVMAYGAWGARAGEIPGHTPVGMDAWSRQYLEWSLPQVPDNGTEIGFQSGLQSPGSAVMLMNPRLSTSEYWLVEYRGPLSWDEGLYHLIGSWDGGLLIQHIDANVGTQPENSFNTFVPGKHQGNVIVEPAAAKCSLLRAADNWGCQSLFYYKGNAVDFDDNSKPSASLYSGTTSGVGLFDVHTVGGKMTATVRGKSDP